MTYCALFSNLELDLFLESFTYNLVTLNTNTSPAGNNTNMTGNGNAIITGATTPSSNSSLPGTRTSVGNSSSNNSSSELEELLASAYPTEVTYQQVMSLIGVAQGAAPTQQQQQQTPLLHGASNSNTRESTGGYTTNGVSSSNLGESGLG